LYSKTVYFICFWNYHNIGVCSCFSVEDEKRSEQLLISEHFLCIKGGNTMSKKVLASIVTMAAAVSMFVSSADVTMAEESKKLVFWDKAEYVAEYATKMKAVVDAFAEENNVEIDYVNVPAADMKQKLMAAIEAGNAPDLIVGDNTLVGQFGALDQLADVTDIIDAFDFTDAAKGVGLFGDVQYMVPQAFTAPGMYVRRDVWEAAGLSMPTTWEELKEQAAQVNDPANGFYGLGFAMGASGGGDAETFVRTIILDFGGVTVDEEGKVTVNSQETIDAFTFIKSLYTEGLISPDAVTGDDMFNNQVYLAGTAGVIINAGSVQASMKNDNPELYANTQIIPVPAGPAGQYTCSGSNCFGVIASGENVDTAKDFISYYFADVDSYEDMIEVMGSMWQPVLNGLDETDFWKEEANQPWMASAKAAVNTYYPAPTDERAMTGFASQYGVKACQEMLINDLSPEEAVGVFEESLLELYTE
jgi:ABC-type glycerol-3-phosphate transport system substrate-binding protein